MGPYVRPVVVVAVIVAVTRLSQDAPLLTVWAASVAACIALAVSVAIHRRHHGPSWLRAWVVLALAVAALAMDVLARADATASGSAGDRWGVVGGVLFVAGATLLLQHRLSTGRGLDVLVEAAIGSLAVGFLVWGLVLVPFDVTVPVADLVRLALPLLHLTGLWLVVRLVVLTDEHPRAYLYLVAAAVTAVAASAVPVGGLLGTAGHTAADAGALWLWSLCLFAAAATDPSMGERFAPVPVRAAKLGWGHILLVVAGLLLSPLVIAWRLASGDVPASLILVGVTVFPLLVVTHLVWQVRERATGEYRAQHDALTGLPNRVLFVDRLEVALAHARRSGSCVGVMFLDLDGFKQINDSLGHGTGDRLLRGVASRLRQALREQDTIARVGGDEFTIILSDVGGQDGCALVAQKVLGMFERPFAVDGRELAISASIGVAVHPLDGDDADTLIKNADTAMYRAKARSRNTIQLYTPEMSAHAQLRLALESGLRTAMDRAQLSLHYQPRVDQSTGSVVAVEALARWRHPLLGYISPDAFIAIAEETGLIDRLGRWALTSAVQQAREWRDRGILDVPVSVNVSARQFEDADDLEQTVVEVLRHSRLPPGCLELELTESVLLQDRQRVARTLANLRGIGVRAAIDDFGTGYSGLMYLTTVPIDRLKIDRAFVATIVSETAPAPIVDAVLALGRILDLGVVAEGVETEDQARFLRARGCNEVQGFLFARPLPAEALEEAARLSRTAGVPIGAVLGSLVPPAAGSPALPGRTPLVDATAVNAVLEAVARMEDPEHADPELLTTVLASLLPRDAPSARLSTKSLSVRIAAGSLVGLFPLSTGLAAAAALPPSAQTVAAEMLRHVGVEVPADADLRSEAGQSSDPVGPVLGARTLPVGPPAVRGHGRD